MSHGKGSGKRRSNTGSKYSDTFLGFVTLHLTEEARDAIEEVRAVGSFDLAGFLEEVTASGYKFSLTRNEAVRSHIATLVGREGSGNNQGYALSGFGPDALGACLALWAKHALVARWSDWLAESDGLEGDLPLYR